LDTSLQWHNRARLKFHRPRRREAAGGLPQQRIREKGTDFSLPNPSLAKADFAEVRPPTIGDPFSTRGHAMRVAIYARVSTDDSGQDPENQLRELRAWCAAAGHAVSREYIDFESGRKGADKRKQFATLFDDAAKRKFDCVLFWALDRFSREGMAQTIIHLQRLSSYGVAFHSYTEPHLATDNELVRNVLLALLSSLVTVMTTKRRL
jgi:predicted site-specific integrase-resolvase